jgi:hypothetical protein
MEAIMILELTGLERGTTTSKAGKTLVGITVIGIKIDRDGNAGEEYEKFLMDWKNPDEIAVLEEAGVGATVEMKSVKNGNFWDLDEVIILEEGDGTPSREPAAKPAKAEPKKPSQAAGGPVSHTVEYQAPPVTDTRVEALRAAVKITDAMLSSDERFKKLMPATKTTVEIVSQMTLENAAKFEAFLKGKSDKVESDDADLDKDGVDAAEPVLPGDED